VSRRTSSRSSLCKPTKKRKLGVANSNQYQWIVTDSVLQPLNIVSQIRSNQRLEQWERATRIATKLLGEPSLRLTKKEAFNAFINADLTTKQYTDFRDSLPKVLKSLFPCPNSLLKDELGITSTQSGAPGSILNLNKLVVYLLNKYKPLCLGLELQSCTSVFPILIFEGSTW